MGFNTDDCLKETTELGSVRGSITGTVRGCYSQCFQYEWCEYFIYFTYEYYKPLGEKLQYRCCMFEKTKIKKSPPAFTNHKGVISGYKVCPGEKLFSFYLCAAVTAQKYSLTKSTPPVHIS